MPLASALPADQFWLARKGKKGPLLLHDPETPQTEAADRICLFDCESGRFSVYPRRKIKPVDNPARLEEEKRRLRGLIMSFCTLPAEPAEAPRESAAAAARKAARAWDLAAAREREETAARKHEAAEALERRIAEARTARETLERYRGALDSADAHCWTGTIRWADGAVRGAVLDPQAQPPGAADHYLLLPAGPVPANVWIAGSTDDAQPPQLLEENEGGARTALAGYRRWQQSEAEEAALAALGSLAESLGTAKPETRVPARVLQPDMNDVRLALLWADDRYHALLAARYHAGSGSVYAFAEAWTGGRGEQEPPEEKGPREELERLLSARMAEKAALWVYERSFRGVEQVHDVAGLQVDAEFGAWWGGRPLSVPDAPYHRYDLEVVTRQGGRYPVDVKNCRAAFIPRDEYRAWISAAPGDRPPWWGTTYREHCVPRFKNDRWGTPVRITGVWSPWAGLTQLLHGRGSDTGQPVVVLGETEHETIRRLEQENPAGSGLEVSFSKSKWNPLDETHLLPPWTFSLPGECYQPPAAEPSTIERHFAAAARRWDLLEDRYWPLFLRCAGPHTAPGWTDALPAPWPTLAETLLQLPSKRRISLPDLYLAVLRHFLDTVRGARGVRFDPERYRTYLFPAGERGMPLGVHDPLRTVDDLVSTLGLLMEGDVPRIAGFKRFRFGSAGVLQASDDGCSWKTLVFPYCGGTGCSCQRLVLGKDGVENCPECGHLACARPECGFCGKNCPEQAKRRKNAHLTGAAATP